MSKGKPINEDLLVVRFSKENIKNKVRGKIQKVADKQDKSLNEFVNDILANFEKAI